MELLLHYIWKHKMFPLRELRTDGGDTVEVIDPGLHNTDAGPDFFNAKVRIGGTLWVGNVEIHNRSSDWYMHGHCNDKAYDNVVLHVASVIDTEVVTSGGVIVPQLQLDVPETVARNYHELLTTEKYPPCYKMIPALPRLKTHGWMSALRIERLEQKTDAIKERVRLCGGSWEGALFVTLARNYGFGVNGSAFETWAKAVPLGNAAHHRDDLFQTEALFMGQAGLLDERYIPEPYRKEAMKEGYFTRLRNEYKYLAHKFSLKPMDASLWKFLRLRPQSFPHIRLSQIATLYCSRRAELGRLVECKTAEDVRELMRTNVSPYWETHYTFGSKSPKKVKSLSKQSLDLLVINTAAPMLFAYGRHRGDNGLCERAADFLEHLKAENNNIVRMWKQCGLDVATAGDSQALIQLKTTYCDRKDCLRCRFGYEYMKNLRGEGGN